MKTENLETKRYNKAFAKLNKAVSEFVKTAKKCRERIRSVSWRTYPAVGGKAGDSRLSVRSFGSKP